MKKRIGLVSNQPGLGKSVTKFIEAADAKELAAELGKLGAKQAVLYWRDRIGDGHTEGQPFALSALTDQHFTWAAETPKDGMRGLFYDTK